MSDFEDDSFIRASLSGHAWRDNSSEREKKRSKGIAPKAFHKNMPPNTAASLHKTQLLVKEARHLVKNHDKTIKSTSLKKCYGEFKEKSFYEEFPLQEPALQALDQLILHRSKYSNADPSPSKQQTQHEDGDGKNQERMYSTEPRIFAIETSKSGKRKYIVCHLGRFMHKYWRGSPPHARHYYELIRDTSPCRLYFDIEYNKLANPTLMQNPNTNIQLMQQFIRQLIHEIHLQFHIQITPQDIIDLDSSTQHKFSRHLIVHMPRGELFLNAMECGIFVKNFVARLVEEVVTDTIGEEYCVLREGLFVYSKVVQNLEISATTSSSTCSQDNETLCIDDVSQSSSLGATQKSPETKDADTDAVNNSNDFPSKHHEQLRNQTLFIDTGVYTRNRLFRLLGSSKYGKPASAALHIADANQFPFQSHFGNAKFFVPSMQELAKQKGGELDEYDHDRMEQEDSGYSSDDSSEQFNWESHAVALEQTLVTPSISVFGNVAILDVGNLQGAAKTDSNASNTSGTRKVHIPCQPQRSTYPSSSSSTYKNNLGPSPFPPLETYIHNHLACRKGFHGEIRAWTVDASSSLIQNDSNARRGNIIYQMKNNRWCENIQRCHKSNNIMWNVSLDDLVYWQSCHDPECRMVGFRGTVKELPKGVQDGVRSLLLEKSISVDDEFEAAISSLDMPMITIATTSPQDVGEYRVEGAPIEDEDEFGQVLAEALLENPEFIP